VTQSAPLRRQLTAELKRLREQAKLTQAAVAQQLEWSPSKVIRIEKGSVKIQVTDLKALLNLYAVTEPDVVDELTQMARGSKRLPLNEYRDVVREPTLTYYQLEIGASIIRHVALDFVPGLLQTDEYVEAIFAVSDVEPERAARLMELRRERRELLDRREPPEMFFILDESLLRRAVGGSRALTRQIEHLADLARHPRISIQVLPFASGAHSAMNGSFIHLEFADRNVPETIYVEHALGDAVFQDDQAVTDSYRRQFQDLEKIATRSGEFGAFLAP
jgi:transcriptional regulator with XRE-family HTH domain